MRSARTTPATGMRRVALAVVALALCSAWFAPAVAGDGPTAVAGGSDVSTGAGPDPSAASGPDVSAGTPSPGRPPAGTVANATGTATNATGPVATPPEPDPDAAVGNDSRPATPRAPDRTGTPAPGGSAVRTAVGEPADRLDGELEREPAAGAVRLGPPATLGPPAPTRGDLRTPARGTGTTTPGIAHGTDDTGDGATRATPTRVAATPTPGAPGCPDCGVPVSVGVVLLGLAGGAGAAAGLGVTPPRPPLGRSVLRRWLDHRLPGLPPVLLGRFGRSADTDPLANTHRERLRELVDDRPGIHLGGLVDEMPLSRSSVRHHVRVLEDADELETSKLLGRRRLYPPDVDTELLAAVADEGSRRVVRAVAAVEPASVGEVVEEADRAYSTVSYHLDRLESAGVVTRESAGREVSVRLTDEAAALLGFVDGDDTAAD